MALAANAYAMGPNILPIADAGEDQRIEDIDGDGLESVQLDGSGSFDQGGMIVSYEWFESEVKVADGEMPFVDLSVGVHDVTLVVTDSDDATDSDTVTITVELPRPSLVISGDVAGQLTWTATHHDALDQDYHAHVRDAQTGGSVADINLGSEHLADTDALADSNPSTNASLIALIVDGSLVPKVRRYSLPAGGLLKTTNVLTADWRVADLASMADRNGDGIGEMAVLAQNSATGEIAAQIRSGGNGAFLNNVFFLNAQWTPRQLLVLDGFDPNAGQELGTLATSSTGQIVVMVRDAATNTFIRNVFFLNSNWNPINAVVLDDFSGNSAAEIALLARNKDSGQLVVMVKDADTNVFLNNVFPLSQNWDPVRVVVLPDENSNGAQELATLGVSSDSGKLVAQIRDGASGVFLRNLEPLGSNWSPDDVISLADIGDGTPSLSVFAERKSDELPVIQSIDSDSGDLLHNVFPD